MIAIVCHDAGGAEVISSWILRNIGEYIYVLDGPAIGIFKKKLGQIQIKNLEYAVGICNFLICGTSWQSDLEKNAIKLANLCNKKVCSYLDHWVNYKQRYWSEDRYYFPNEIWVCDDYAYEIAKKDLPGIDIKLVGNLYFEDIKNQLSNIETRSQIENSILYICEPIAEHSLVASGFRKSLGYDERDAIEFFLDKINFINPDTKLIKLRPHPSESIEKYDWVKYATSISIDIGKDTSLISDICTSEFIVGCESMAMVIGIIAKKNVISCIPPGGRFCSLPHKEIIYLSNMINESIRN